MQIPTPYVLSTRALAASLIDEAAAKGVRIDIRSFIAIEPLKGGVGELGKRSLTAVFTSGNAVAAIEEGGDNWKVYCIGQETRRKAVERFGEGAIAGVANSAKTLAEEIIRREGQPATGGQEGREIIFFCGDQRRDELPDLLRQAGLTVREVVVYRTRLTPQQMKRAYAGIAFFSPSAVESFFSVNGVSPETVLFAIGGTTAAAIRERCVNELVIADRPSPEEMIRQMIEHFQI